MLAQSGMYDPAIEQNLRCIGNGIECLQGLLEFIIIVMRQRLHPSFDLLINIDLSSANLP